MRPVQQNSSNDNSVKPGSRKKPRVAAIVALFLLIYIPLSFSWFSGKPVSTDILRDGSLYEAFRADAIIVRDEELLYSPSDGFSIPSVNEGERVPGHSQAATIYSFMSYELMDELKQTNLELLKLQYETLGRGSVIPQDVTGIEKDISDEIRKMIADVRRHSISEAFLRTKSINALLLKRAEAYGAIETDDPQIVRLKADKRAIEAEVAQNCVAIMSDSPGYLSLVLDGNELALNPEDIQSMTVSAFDELFESAESAFPVSAGNSYGGIAVKAGEPFAKIVKDNVFYLVVKAPMSFVNQYSVGDRIRLLTESPYREFDKAVIDAVIVVVVGGGGDDGLAPLAKGGMAQGGFTVGSQGGFTVGGGGSGGLGQAPEVEYGLLSIKLTKYLFDFLQDRTISASLLIKYQEGLKIPLKCLRDIDLDEGEANITLLKGTTASVRKVKILASNDMYAIIDSVDGADAANRVNRYDTYIRDTANIEDGMQMNK